MDSTILTGIAAASAAITGLLTIWNFFQSPAKKNEADIAAMGASIGAKLDRLSQDLEQRYTDIDDKVDAVAARVSTLETVIKHMPDKDNMHALELSMVRLSERMDAYSAKLESVEHLLRRVQTMMTAGGRE